METIEQSMRDQVMEDINDNPTDQQYAPSQKMVAPTPTPQADVKQRGGYEMQDCCADTCYCIGFIFTFGLITLCCDPNYTY